MLIFAGRLGTETNGFAAISTDRRAFNVFPAGTHSAAPALAGRWDDPGDSTFPIA